jgi:hypothetical protein
MHIGLQFWGMQSVGMQAPEGEQALGVHSAGVQLGSHMTTPEGASGLSGLPSCIPRTFLRKSVSFAV